MSSSAKSSSRSRSMLLAMVVVVVAGIMTASSVHGWKVQIVPNQTTSVKYVVPVVTSFTTVPSTCYVAVNVTGGCRRRRSLQEKPDVIQLLDDLHIDDILPTLPRLEASAIAESSMAPSIEASVENGVSEEELKFRHPESKRALSFTVRPLDFTRKITRGYTKINRWISDNRPHFGLTYVDFRTVTVTQTTVSTVTDGQKSFAIVGCLPSAFAYTPC